MSEEYSASIVIPCFNEEECICSCLDRLSSIKITGEILVVDDGSKDQTAKVVQEKIKGSSVSIKLIRLKRNYGKAKAAMYGITAAKGAIIILHDADMIIQPKTLEEIYRLIKNRSADVIFGTRFIYSENKDEIKISNLIGNKLLALSFSFLIGQKITDVLCGLKAFRREDFLRMGPGQCRWGDLDILIGSKKLGLKLQELPIHYLKRRAGISKMDPFYDTYLFTKQTIKAFYELKIKKLFVKRDETGERQKRI